MVGKNAEISKKLAKLLSKKYKYGETDCLTLLKVTYGNKLPKEYKGITLDNYINKFESPEEASNFLAEAVRYYFKETETPFFGDVCIIDNINLVGIFCGNDIILTALIDKGIVALPIKFFKAKFYKLNG